MRNLYVFENTDFIFQTNLAGEYRKEDRYPSSTRTCNIIIPDLDLAQEMIEDGFSVRVTRPKEGYEEDFIPEYFIKATLKFKNEGGAGNPTVCYVDADGYSVPLSAETVGEIDHMRIKRGSVCVSASPYTKGEHPTLYIRQLYVTQDVDADPWASRFPRRPQY